MLNPTREQIAVALFNQIKTKCGNTFVSYGRRPDLWEKFNDKPCLQMGQMPEKYQRDHGTATGPIVTLPFDVWIYFDVRDPNSVPDTILNALIDSVEAALAPNPGQAQTLGFAPGLIYSAWIDPEIHRFPGYMNGQGGAIIMVNVEVPQ